MNKKVLLAVISIVLFIFVAQPCWAIIIDYVPGSGEIKGELGTTYDGGHEKTTQGFPHSNTIWMNYLSKGIGAYGKLYASATHLAPNEITFDLTTEALSRNDPDNLTGFSTWATVKSTNMLEFELKPETGEVIGQSAILQADAFIEGLMETDFGDTSGQIIFDFEFNIYKDQYSDPIMTFSYNDAYSQFFDAILLEFDTMIDENFKIGDSFFVDFEQMLMAKVTEESSQNAHGSLVHSNTDIVTLKLEARTIPEPSIIILLGSLIIGVAIIERKRNCNYRSKKEKS